MRTMTRRREIRRATAIVPNEDALKSLASPRTRWEGITLLIVSIIFLLLIVVFAVQNAQVVPITFLAWSLSLNLALVVLGSASIGAIVGALWSWLRGIQNRGRVKELQRQLEEARERNSTLERAMNDLMNMRDARESSEPPVSQS
jgi:putative membrane protein